MTEATSNGNPPSAMDHTTIHCNRRDDGPPFMLKVVHTCERVDASELELALTRRLSVSGGGGQTSNGDSSGSGENYEDLEYLTRYDAHWLQIADHPPNYELQTVLGIIEDSPYTTNDDEDRPSNLDLPVDVVCFEPSTLISQHHCNGNGNSRNISLLDGPTHEWKRKVITEEQLDITVKPPNSALSPSTLMWWVDMRPLMSDDRDGCRQPLISTQPGIVQLLRSILTSSHNASPWVPEDRRPNDGANDEELQRLSPDIVVLVMEDDNGNKTVSSDFDDTTPSSVKLLKDFRVGDVAPSWFLHAVARMDDVEDSSTLFGVTKVTNDNGDAHVVSLPKARLGQYADNESASLLIYKRLGRRSALTAIHPLTKSVDIPRGCFGCLWEAYNGPEADEKKDDECQTNNSKKGPPEKQKESSDSEDQNNDRQYRLTCPPYVNLYQDYPPQIQQLFSKESLEVFLRDALSIPQWTPWPETAHYRVSSDDPGAIPWTVFPLCHCFPANKPENLTWVPATKAFVPQTCQLLEDLVGCHGYLRTALFSQLAPHSVLEAHTGWADLANHVLRLHIPLVVPSEEEGLCGTWVDGCVETHKTGRPLLFDDSKIHRAFNYSDETRVVLIVDLARPDTLPVGTATGGHSEELDDFIQRMGMPR